jgi:Putative copper export protein
MVTTLIINRAVHIGASILIAGIFTFDLVTLGLAGPVKSDLHEIDRRLFSLALWSLLVSLASAVLWFWLEVANMNGLSFVDALSARAWQKVLFETVFGHLWLLRLGIIAVALVLAVSQLAGNDVPRRPAILALWSLSIVLLVSLAWISHAAAAGVQPISLIGDALHLCAAGGWIGGLVPLAIFLARVRVSSSLSEMAAQVLHRFSVLSLSCVSVLVVSGISNSWLLVGSVHALLTTPYGRLLLFKLMLFGILIAFGARNRFFVKAMPLRAPVGRNVLAQLRRNVTFEACLGAAVVVIVACLGVTPPARHP